MALYKILFSESQHTWDGMREKRKKCVVQQRNHEYVIGGELDVIQVFGSELRSYQTQRHKKRWFDLKIIKYAVKITRFRE